MSWSRRSNIFHSHRRVCLFSNDVISVVLSDTWCWRLRAHARILHIVLSSWAQLLWRHTRVLLEDSFRCNQGENGSILAVFFVSSSSLRGFPSSTDRLHIDACCSRFGYCAHTKHRHLSINCARKAPETTACNSEQSGPCHPSHIAFTDPQKHLRACYHLLHNVLINMYFWAADAIA